MELTFYSLKFFMSFFSTLLQYCVLQLVQLEKKLVN